MSSIAFLFWMAGMTAIAVLVERRTARLEKMLGNEPDKADDGYEVGKDAQGIEETDASALGRDGLGR